MYFPRPLLKLLLLAGVVFGYGSAIHDAAAHCRAHRAAMMQSWASTCAAAAKNPSAVPPAPPPGW